MARRYASAGFAVVIDDVLVSSDGALDCLKLLDGLTVHRILLRPPVETALRRNRARSNKSFDTSILEESIRRLDQVYEGIDLENSNWLVINNDNQTPEQTANQICGAMGIGAMD
jgi:chloramphenicol 3-O-phosphotransferase